MTEDLGVKLGTPEEVEWTEILEREETNLRKNKINQELEEVIIELAKKRIAEEKEKFK